jgi:hypothetical protein
MGRAAEPSSLRSFLECGRVRVIAADVAQQRRKFGEAARVEISGMLDALAGALRQLLHRPVGARHADDRDVEPVAPPAS